MEITLSYSAEKNSTLAQNEAGHQVWVTPSKEAITFGMAPMQLVLVSLASCSTPDIVEILIKQRQTLEGLSVKVKGERAKSLPAVFTKIHLHYVFQGQIEPLKAKKAIQLALEKYCSVAAMLKPTVEITTSFEIIA